MKEEGGLHTMVFYNSIYKQLLNKNKWLLQIHMNLPPPPQKKKRQKA